MIQAFSSFAAEAELSEEMLGNVFANYERCVTYSYTYIYRHKHKHTHKDKHKQIIHTYIHCITLHYIAIAIAITITITLHYITLHTYIARHNHT